MARNAPDFVIAGVELFERPTPLRLPFRFGAVTLTAAPQAFVRVTLRFADATHATGMTAELMVPKWFDKNPALSDDDNITQLRLSLRLAADAYTSEALPRTAFGHAAAQLAGIVAAGARHRLPPLAAAFGAAEIDKAIVDALCQRLGVSFGDALRANAIGLDAALTPDLADADFDAFLAALDAAPTIECRHTVGMADAIDAGEASIGDGLPATLADAVAVYGLRWLKLKLGGRADEDLARLARIARVLDHLPAYRTTLDGNEQYEVAALAEFVARLRTEPALARLAASVAWIEQPIARAATMHTDVAPLARAWPLMIDEADDGYAAYPRARALGYAGVSSKSCKGLYKALVNRLRVTRFEAAGARAFVSAEDLTAQAGLAVQQDCALAAILGCSHAERNGHHYADGMSAAPRDEQRRFVAAHPDLYSDVNGVACLRVHDGRIDLGSLDAPGFAHRADPDFHALTPISVATAQPSTCE
ncbi:MAG: mandelate racemase [Betaproteobacteria bacterium]